MDVKKNSGWLSSVTETISAQQVRSPELRFNRTLQRQTFVKRESEPSVLNEARGARQDEYMQKKPPSALNVFPIKTNHSRDNRSPKRSRSCSGQVRSKIKGLDLPDGSKMQILMMNISQMIIIPSFMHVCFLSEKLQFLKPYGLKQFNSIT